MDTLTDGATYFEKYGEQLVKEKKMSKTEFADKMGVKKQNVNALFATKNILILRKAAQVLDVPLEKLIADGSGKEEVAVNGFVEVNSEIYRIRNKEELLRAFQAVEEAEAKAELR